MRKVLIYGDIVSVVRAIKSLEILPIRVEAVTMRQDYSEFGMAKVVQRIDDDLYKRYNENDLIVLSDPISAAVAKKELKRRHPKQKIVGYGQGIVKLAKEFGRICILVTQRIKRTEIYQKMKAECQGTEIIEPDPINWIEMLKRRWPGKEEKYRLVKSAQGAPIVVFHPKLPFFRVREFVDWRGEVVNMEKALIKTIETELGLIN